MNRLKELRNEKKLKQVELASMLKIRQASYSAWETNKSKIDVISLIKLAKFYAVSTDYLLGLTDIKNAVSAEENEILNKATYEQKEVIKLVMELNTLQLAKAHGYLLGLTSKTNTIIDNF